MARFLGVAPDRAGAAISIETGSLGLHEHRHFRLVRSVEQAIGKSVPKQPFVIIGKHESIKLFQRSDKDAKKLLFRLLGNWITAFAVDAHNVLMLRDDAGLKRRHAIRIGNNPAVTNTQLAQAGVQCRAGFVRGVFFRIFAASRSSLRADYAENVHLRAERGDIDRHVARSAAAILLRYTISNPNPASA